MIPKVISNEAKGIGKCFPLNLRNRKYIFKLN
jgi:hypothetical protein